MRDLAIGEPLGQYADHLASGLQCTVGDCAHAPHCGTSVYNTNASPREISAEFPCGAHETRISAVA